MMGARGGERGVKRIKGKSVQIIRKTYEMIYQEIQGHKRIVIIKQGQIMKKSLHIIWKKTRAQTHFSQKNKWTITLRIYLRHPAMMIVHRKCQQTTKHGHFSVEPYRVGYKAPDMWFVFYACCFWICCVDLSSWVTSISVLHSQEIASLCHSLSKWSMLRFLIDILHNNTN